MISNRKNDEMQKNFEVIRFGQIYEAVGELDEPVFGYVRGWRDGSVGFSVLDHPTTKPDFANCGVFWVAPEDFKKLFKEFGERIG